MNDKKTAKLLYIFEKLFEKLVEGADGPKCALQQYYIFEKLIYLFLKKNILVAPEGIHHVANIHIFCIKL